jgi:hypothetical protein
VLHLQKIIRCPLNMLADLMPMRGTIEERPENEHIQGALENCHTLLCLSCGGSHSTLNGD